MIWININDISYDVQLKLIEAYTYSHPREPDIKFTTLVMLPNRIGIPAGDTNKWANILPNVVVDVQSISTPFERPIKLTGLELRDYQEDALQEVLDYFHEDYESSFNLSGAPGSGKSVMLSAILAEMGVKTLIIAHLSMLTTQLKEEIEQFTDAKVTVLDKDNTELGDINIATSQFIANRPELWYKIKREIGLIAVDEAETIGADTTLKILQRAHAKYRIAITATFTRSVDGRTPALTDMIGHKVISLKNDALLKPTVISVNCEEHFQTPRNKNLYKKMLVNFFKRSHSIDLKILTIVETSIKKNRQVLIACDLMDMQDRYASVLEARGFTCGVMNGSTKKADRARILEDFNDGKIDVLLGFGVLNAGLSMPKISTIIRVSTPGNVEKLEQLIGRSVRDFDGKEGAFIIDLLFSGFSNEYGSGQNDKRLRFYRKQVKEQGWKHVNVSWEAFQRKLKADL